jgi:hypothetical protein
MGKFRATMCDLCFQAASQRANGEDPLVPDACGSCAIAASEARALHLTEQASLNSVASPTGTDPMELDCAHSPHEDMDVDVDITDAHSLCDDADSNQPKEVVMSDDNESVKLQDANMTDSDYDACESSFADDDSMDFECLANADGLFADYAQTKLRKPGWPICHCCGEGHDPCLPCSD